MRRSVFKKGFWITILILFFVLLGVFLFLSRPGKNIINPIISSVYNFDLGLGKFGQKISDQNELIAQNDELKQKLIDLTTENAQLKSCLSENESLRQQVNLAKTENYSMITGRVIGKLSEFAGAEAVFIFNQGSRDGIQVGYPLILSNTDSTQGILIGKVIKVTSARAYFILINNYHSAVAGLVLNKKDESVCLVSGSRDSVMGVEFLPINKEVSKDDLVVTSGLEDNIPKGLLIGKVSSVESEQGSLFHVVKLESLVTMDHFNILSAVVPSADDAINNE
ncbi:MAG: rod shape-determining protein MreC [Patescibacteria group bacterium]